MRESRPEDFFKVFFNWTMNAGVTYYRMMNFAKFMRRQAKTQIAYSNFKATEQSTVEWEQILEEGGDQLSNVIKQMDTLMDINDISVWQVAHSKVSYSLYRAYRHKFDKKKPILIEADDYFFGVNPENAASMAYYSNSDLEYFAEMQMRNANALIVSTDYLKEKYSKFNECIEVIPNAIDFEIWDAVKDNRKQGRVRIGFAGGSAHYYDLKVMAKVIPIILKKHKNVDFVFFGHMPDYINTARKIRHHSKWMGILDYPGELASLGIDIGVAPLRDNQFNRAKSNLRWLEYSALKIPTVASPVGPFKECINPGMDGLFALEVDEWVAQLSYLIKEKSERYRMGKSAYNRVKEHYNAEKVSKDYLNVLEAFAKGKKPVKATQYDDGETLTV